MRHSLTYLMRRHVRALLPAALIMSLALASCHSSKRVVYFQDRVTDTVTAAPVQRTIKVRPGDMIYITVASKDPQLAALFNPVAQISQNNQNSNVLGGSGASGAMLGTTSSTSGGNASQIPYTVDSAGDIDFPVLGALHVAGLDRQQIAQLVKKRIKAGGYIQDPSVNVSFMNLHYSVLGDVTKPGVYYISDDRTTLLDALATAGDLNITGRRDRVYVTRTEQGRQVTHHVDLTTSDVYSSPAYYIQQDDVIYVEPNEMRAGQSSVNDNTFRGVGFWMSLASVIMSLSVLIFK